MQVHVRHASFDKYSQEAAPKENGPHRLGQRKKKKKELAVPINENE